MKSILSIEKLSYLLRDRKVQNRFLIAVFLIFGLLVALRGFSSPEPKAPPLDQESLPSFDTFIPAGHTLVPIEVTNGQQLSSLIGRVGGSVDLYGSSVTGKRTKLIMSQVKILRAPNAPDSFAALTDDRKTAELLVGDGPFHAVIHNPNKPKGSRPRETTKAKIEINYQDLETL